MDNALYQLIVGALVSWQMRVIVGLILLDLIFGIAAALRTGVFRWGAVATFYKTNVLPYILGYIVLFVAIRFIIPPGALAGYGNELSDGAVLVAWGTLFATLFNSVLVNFRTLYRPPPLASGNLDE